ncbi:MAG: adenylosuccinate lyase [Patescibacteria group bacterium]|jgi:adenylosuccinate lyase
MALNTLTSISPLDGRYRKNLEELAAYYSEMALMKYRVKIEVLYLLALSKEKGIKELKLSSSDKNKLAKIYENFTEADAKKIKEIEKTTNHDVKAVEYFIKSKVNSEFVHFALTSEDINNLAYSLMLKDGINNVLLPTIIKLQKKLKELATKYRSVSLLALTHGQPATPTTIGKELAVFASRLNRQIKNLKTIKLQGKFSGATGNWAAHTVACPNVNWLNFSRKFVTSLGLEPNFLTTQIENHDSLAETYDAVRRINNIVRDLDQDMWLYISRGIFKQQNKKGEIGSSAMPHKINPIFFENSEGNAGMANAILSFLSDKLPVSRMQRDLTDSTVLRNQGSAVSYSILAYKNTLKALDRVEVDKETCATELNKHWEVLAEAIQTVLRKYQVEAPYEKLKELTRGQEITKESMSLFIDSLDLPKSEKQKLQKLSPALYTGLSAHLTKLLR